MMKHIVFLLALYPCFLIKSQELPEIEDIVLDKIEDVPELIHISLTSYINKISGKEIQITEEGSFIYKDSSFADGNYLISLTKIKGDIIDPITYGSLEGRVINGKKEGEWHTYVYTRDTSALVKISNYSNGLLDGKYIIFNYDGDTLHYWSEIENHPPLHSVFEKGTGHYYDYYYDIGTLSVEGFMKNGKRHRYWIYYDRQGNEIRREYYNYGFLINQ